jgi:hypothetical protein
LENEPGQRRDQFKRRSLAGRPAEPASYSRSQVFLGQYLCLDTNLRITFRATGYGILLNQYIRYADKRHSIYSRQVCNVCANGLFVNISLQTADSSGACFMGKRNWLSRTLLTSGMTERERQNVTASNITDLGNGAFCAKAGVFIKNR